MHSVSIIYNWHEVGPRGQISWISGGIDKFDDPRELRNGLRRAGIEPGYEVLDAELAEAQNRRRDLLVSATDWIGTLAEVSRHGDVSAGLADQRRRIPA